MLAVSIVLTFALRSVLYDQAKTKIDRIAADIVRSVGPTGGIGDVGDALPIDQELLRNLDHFSSPTTYIEVDSPRGAHEGKSSNVADFFEKRPLPPKGRAIYSIEMLGKQRVLVRSEFLTLYDNSQIVIDIGEDLDIYDQTLDRVRALLAIVALVASLGVIVASFLLARNVIRPIDRTNAWVGRIGATNWARSRIRSTRCSIVSRTASRASGNSSPMPRTNSKRR